jgi:uncharacterized protein YndB with AHSA1/START domain
VSLAHISDTFTVAQPPDAVFAFIAEPANLAKWQTIKTHVTLVSDGPMGVGSVIREGNKAGPRRWEQLVEITEFEPGRVFAVHVVEGQPSSGRWTFEPEGAGSRVHFEATFQVPGLLEPIAKRFIARSFRGYHANLRRHLEARPPDR